MAKEIDSIDSATIVIGRDTGKSKENHRSVDMKLSDVDRIFIRDSVEKGFSKDTTYNALTEHRLKQGRSRILKRLVDKEYESIDLTKSFNFICPVSGVKADSILKIALITRDGKISDSPLNICIPVNKEALTDYQPSIAVVQPEYIKDGILKLIDDLPILKNISFIGAKK